MKKYRCLLTASLLAVAAWGEAQTLHVEESSVSYDFPAAATGEMVFGAGNTLTVGGRTFALTDAVRMWVDSESVEDNVVTVTYLPAGAHVSIAGNIAQYVDATVSGGDVVITQSSEVSASTCGEITYRLSGNSQNGSFYLSGAFKSTVELCGLDLTNPRGAALDIQNGKRVALRMAEATVNTLTDGTEGSQKGCIVCKGHLELKGSGILNVSGNSSHAIYAKEYIELANCEVNVLSAKKDGVNCNQYFLMKSGRLTIDNTGDDGVQVSFKDDADREAEDTGEITIRGGKLKVNVSADAAKGLKCEGPMQIAGGEIEITVSGDGIWDSAKSKTKASACLGSDGDMTVSGGTLNLTATGGGGKGINCDGNFTMSGGNVEILTTGGVVAYVNGKLYTNYTGNTDRLDSDSKSSPKGIKADGNIDINGGEIYVTTTGKGAEGIESKSVLTINEGVITVNSTDDAINSSSHMYIKGGTVTVVATGNDGLDSNGNLYLQGGYVMAFGAGAPECGIDANEEERYTVIFSGGTLLAVGGNNSVPSSSSGSTQAYVTTNGSVTANSKISLTDSAGKILATFTVPANYKASSSGGNRPGGGSGGSVLITCPDIVNGSKYTLTNGATNTSVTARLTGSSGGGWKP